MTTYKMNGKTITCTNESYCEMLAEVAKNLEIGIACGAVKECTLQEYLNFNGFELVSITLE